MKKYAILAALGLVAGCASNSADVVATEEPAAPVDTIAPGSQEDLERYADARVYFGYDQHTLTANGQAALQKQAEWLQANPTVSVQLTGNCDERGTREYNFALGARRATAAKSYLVSLGVDAARLSTKSNGKEQPFAMGTDESAWSQNRKSTTTVLASY